MTVPSRVMTRSRTQRYPFTPVDASGAPRTVFYLAPE